MLTAASADKVALSKLKKQLAGQLRCVQPTNAQLITALASFPDSQAKAKLRLLLTRRAVRTMSGIAAVAVLTKPYACPGNCAYCPNQPNVPRSYLSNEPAVMRAAHCHYKPVEQVHYRLKALEANGHYPTKIELIVIGGTWSFLPKKYQYWYIASCFFAANTHSQNTKRQPLPASASLTDLRVWLKAEQHLNETAVYRLIGITLETRPDYIDAKELLQMRDLGATRIELGVQAIDDQILKLNNRGSTVADVVMASELARSFGFKITYHFMPALPGSTPEHDYEMFDGLFSKETDTITLQRPAKAGFTKKQLQELLTGNLTPNPFNPDQLKFYPTVVTKGSLLYDWWKQGKYQPYSDEQLSDLIKLCKKRTPPTCRIIRLIRDIPGDSIEAGNLITNLRQVLKNQGVKCRCIRCREAQGKPAQLSQLLLTARRFDTPGAREYFLSYEDADDVLYGFLRLRLPQTSKTAMLRELHIYGNLAALGKQANAQHRGLGTLLIEQAEKLALAGGYTNMSIIAGVGTRHYYRRFGYRLSNEYMVKKLCVI